VIREPGGAGDGAGSVEAEESAAFRRAGRRGRAVGFSGALGSGGFRGVLGTSEV
jgi:hypothetical protein